MANPSSSVEPKRRVRVMLDATVLFAGSGWPRWSYEVLRHAAQGDFQLVLAPLIIRQAQRNLAVKAPTRSAFLQQWLKTCPLEMIADPSSTDIAANQHLVRQREDIPVALAAIQALVDYFVTEDKDFTDQVSSTYEVRKQLIIMRPVIFLREVMGWSSAELEQIRNRVWPQ